MQTAVCGIQLWLASWVFWGHLTTEFTDDLGRDCQTF